VKGYAPGLSLQVSGISDFSWSLLNCFYALLLFCLLLLDRLSNQLVGYFVRGVYTYEKDAMQELEEQRCTGMRQGAYDAMPCSATKKKDKTRNITRQQASNT